MEVWLIEDGEKRGPLSVYQVEDRIRAGELTEQQPAWMGGEAEWRPLGELPVFAAAFRELAEQRQQVALPPPLPEVACSHGLLWRRFWARWFDLQLYGLLWWGGMRLTGRDLTQVLESPWLMVLQFAPWVAFEAWLLHRFATTPGKALLGIFVTGSDGAPLSLKAAVVRALRVWTLGVGLGVPWLAEVCQAVSWWTARQTGRAMWDSAGGHRLQVVVPHSARVVGFVLLFVLILHVRAWLLLPAMAEIYGNHFPWLRELWGK